MKLTKLNDLIEGGRGKKGRWELTSNHEVVYKSEGLDEEIRFMGSLIAAEPDALVLAVTERQSDQKVVTGLTKLSGAWKANARNQLLFEVEKEGGKKDVLTFRSGWKLDDRNRIVYSYEQTSLKKKQGLLREILFDGHWDLSEKNRLVYLVGGNSDSAFRFRGAFQTRSVFAKKGEIRYQLGAEINGRYKPREIILFGKWKVSRDLGLSFEIDEGRDKKRSLSFGGEVNLNGGKQISVELKSRKGEPLGFEVIFTKDFAGRDGQAFLRLRKSLEESSVEGGVKIRF